jgi:HD-GYP domain-containing protein (c-di-GMP phosphodiesterase class II)
MNYDPAKLFDIIIAFRSEKNYLDLLNIILAKMMELTNADAGTLYIVEDGKLHFRIIRNITLNIFQSSRDKIELPPITLDPENIANVCAYAAIKNEIHLIDDVYESDEPFAQGPRNYDKLTGYRTCAMLTMPLTATVGDEVEVIGVFQLINPIDEETGLVASFGNIFDPPILPSIANIAANTLANLLHEKEIKDLLYSFVRVMTKAIDERSPYNSNHTNNVAEYCNRFALYLTSRFPDKDHKYYFGENRREQLVMAALLHDIGKIITPLHIMDKPDRLGEQLEIVKYKSEIKKHQLEVERLSGKITDEEHAAKLTELQESLLLIEEINTAGFIPDDKFERVKKLGGFVYLDNTGQTVPVLTDANIASLSVRRGTLTDEERNIMQEHASVTYRLLENMIFSKNYKNVTDWASGHHEYTDGSGYPNRLSGGDVTTEMSILTMADIYDALTASDRPYKRATPPDKALGILSAMASEGKFPKELAELFTESEAWKI